MVDKNHETEVARLLNATAQQEIKTDDLKRLFTTTTAQILGPVVAVDYQMAKENVKPGENFGVDTVGARQFAANLAFQLLKGLGYPVHLLQGK